MFPPETHHRGNVKGRLLLERRAWTVAKFDGTPRSINLPGFSPVISEECVAGALEVAGERDVREVLRHEVRVHSSLGKDCSWDEESSTG